MGRLFFIFFIIILANFVKKILEAAKQSEQNQETPGSKDIGSLNDLLNQDEFLKAFQKQSAPVQKADNLLEVVADEWQEEEETFHERLSERPDYKEIQHSDFQGEREKSEWQDWKNTGLSPRIGKKADVKVDLSPENIPSAFLLKEILSPPISLRSHDEGFLG